MYNEKTIGHYRGDKGYRSCLIMLPEKRFGLVLLANFDYNEDFRQKILHSILKQKHNLFGCVLIAINQF